MNIRMITLAAALAGLAGPTMAQDAPATQVFRDGDRALTCEQIASEAEQLSQSMGDTPDGGVFGRLGGVARSGAALLIPGAGLAMAGADVVTAPGRERREAEEKAREGRWYYLNGLYAGRACAPPPAASAATPPPAVQPAPAH